MTSRVLISKADTDGSGTNTKRCIKTGKRGTQGYICHFLFLTALRTNGRVAQAKSDLNSVKIDEKKLTDCIALQVRESLNAFEEANKIVEALSDTVKQAEKLLYLSEKGYEFGVKIRLKVEDAELNLQQAKGNLARA